MFGAPDFNPRPHEQRATNRPAVHQSRGIEVGSESLDLKKLTK